MDLFYGFDLGDAESAIALLKGDETTPPGIVPVEGAGSFITAYARLPGGEMLIGENACYHAQATVRKLRFKSRFLKDKKTDQDVKLFAQGVLASLEETEKTDPPSSAGRMDRAEGTDASSFGDGAARAEKTGSSSSGGFAARAADLEKETGETLFYIGCPAGWDKYARERYRSIFQEAGYPPSRIVSESRAALVSACQSRHLQVGYDILSRPVLVVDIGSSTTDFAYICGGKEVEMQTAGEVSLGGGIMDELLLEEAIGASSRPDEIRKVFEKSEPWRTYCEFSARRLKEKYFSDEEYWQEMPCKQAIRIYYDRPLLLTLQLNEAIAKKLLEGPSERLEGRSFREVFLQSLENVREHISGEQPELLLLTGGVCRMNIIRTWCKEAFPEAVVIVASEPEFAVARGLAWSGRIDSEIRHFRAELSQLIASSTVEDIVRKHIGDLYKTIVDTLVQPALTKAALPVFDDWRSGKIRRLCDTDEAMKNAMEEWLRTQEAREMLYRPVASWLRPVADELEEYTLPICLRNHVPYSALSLKSYLRLTDIDIKIDTRNVFAVEEITWMIDSVISLIVGLLCGGSGIALISSGPTGILAGIVVSFLVLALGKNKMEKALLKWDIPLPMRRLVPGDSARDRMDDIAENVRDNLYESLEKDKNEEITEHLTQEISSQIEQCLSQMAEVVEIPLG